MRHKHADLMIAFANDSSLKFQFRAGDAAQWEDTGRPAFNESYEYRIKPKPVTKEEAKAAWMRGRGSENARGWFTQPEIDLVNTFFNQP